MAHEGSEITLVVADVVVRVNLPIFRMQKCDVLSYVFETVADHSVINFKDVQRNLWFVD